MLFDLVNRKARCTCGKVEDSSFSLPFFMFCGEHSYSASICKNCGTVEDYHLRCPICRGEKYHRNKPCYRCNATGETDCKCKSYEPRGGIGEDSYYCGHFGWD